VANQGDRQFLREFFGRLDVSQMPASPTNRFADDPVVAELGERFFFDKNLSADNTVACVSCHVTDANFADPNTVSIGIGGQVSLRRAPSAMHVGWMEFTLWDGRADSAWSQPLKAMEAPHEMGITRTEVAHYVSAVYTSAYTDAFGSLPKLPNSPFRGKPGDVEWEQMFEEDQDAINEVFVNVGKAIEAYERTLVCDNTRFDRFLDGADNLSQQEIDGAIEFVQSGCAGCHSGALLTDNEFHNIGIASDVFEDDLGREAAYELMDNDEFSSESKWSDDPAFGTAKIDRAFEEPDATGAFKTPSLRGVGQRTAFMHNGSIDRLERVLSFYRAASQGARQPGHLGQLDPFVRELEVLDDRAIIAFLRTLDCE